MSGVTLGRGGRKQGRDHETCSECLPSVRGTAEDRTGLRLLAGRPSESPAVAEQVSEQVSVRTSGPSILTPSFPPLLPHPLQLEQQGDPGEGKGTRGLGHWLLLKVESCCSQKGPGAQRFPSLRSHRVNETRSRGRGVPVWGRPFLGCCQAVKQPRRGRPG